MSGRAPEEKLKKLLTGYFDIVDQDLQAAKLLAENGNRAAAFHVQQAVEKMAKAALVNRGIEPGIEHNLTALLERLPQDDATRARLWPLRSYAAFATTYRYPTPGGRVPDAPAKDVLTKDIEQAMEHARAGREELVPNRAEHPRRR